MGRIEDLRKQNEMDDAAVPTATTQTATAVLEPPVIPATVPAASDTPIPAANESVAVETVSKEEYAKQTELVGQLISELDRVKAAKATLEGKYKAEVPILQAKVRELEAQLAGNRQITDDGSKKLPKTRDDFGDDMADEIAAEFKALQDKIATLEAKEKAVIEPTPDSPSPKTVPVAAGTPSTDFITDLTKAYPGWMYINGYQSLGIPKHPKWQTFLLMLYPGSNKSYDDVLQTHVNNNDAAGAAAIFKAFDDANKTSKPNPTGDLTGVDAFVDPAPAGGTPPPPGNKPILKITDYKKFMDDRRLGRLTHMTAAEMQAKEAEYDQADAEGRLR
jgi:hypothetical protein